MIGRLSDQSIVTSYFYPPCVGVMFSDESVGLVHVSVLMSYVMAFLLSKRQE